MAIADVNGDHVTVVELVSNSNSTISSSSSNSLIIDTISSSSSSSSTTAALNLNLNLNLNDEIIPLLTEQDKPKINIFTISYSRTKPPNKEKGMKVLETDVSLLPQFISWTWGGSKYSGLLCMIISSTIYSIMEVFSYTFAVGRIPLFETIFTRCAVIMFSSFVWLRRTRQPIFGPPHIVSFAVSKAYLFRRLSYSIS
ncbi:hypothetical protein AQUCO_03200065v1 [Aquilegia coerulea]|uniref:Uncharacterized protein n=1 Tax=Aquilegia coerulea TaxID=218851 RepID=A0A2G5D012_AQUCA|nr:hypothetical protein AQUCO_03200065v1 [Aquilegia coerulea]